ncbi:MAG: cell division protein FtsL [Rhodobacteraceae bacterium]|nr:cell division protein FtsL [Paracoccaceae bacterium]MCY4137781.1 cell division protein FtsL [Paracoccaceae bacterium]
MLRAFVTAACFLAVFVTAVWAYRENIKTRADIKRLDTLKREISLETNRLALLRAEWAYLNRPNRLDKLAAMVGGDTALTPMADTRFGDIRQVEMKPSGEPTYVALILQPGAAGRPS